MCLVRGTRRSRISPCVPVSPCGFGAAHGKYDFHRVPEELHTAKFLAHGELLVSGSDSQMCVDVVHDRQEAASKQAARPPARPQQHHMTAQGPSGWASSKQKSRLLPRHWQGVQGGHGHGGGGRGQHTGWGGQTGRGGGHGGGAGLQE